MADTDSSIYQYRINMDELLYISWGHRKSKEEVAELYQKALEAERLEKKRIRGLSVLQDIPFPESGTQERTDKSEWDKGKSLAELLGEHWEELSRDEQDEIAAALDDGLTEEQIKELLFLEPEEMATWHRAYMVTNRG